MNRRMAKQMVGWLMLTAAVATIGKHILIDIGVLRFLIESVLVIFYCVWIMIAIGMIRANSPTNRSTKRRLPLRVEYKWKWRGGNDDDRPKSS